MKTIAAVFLSWLVAFASPALADDAADRAAMRDIISGQIAAFQADDGARAYSFASPMIQSVYPTPDQFMAMVRGGYQPVYRPRSFTFGETSDTANGPLQKVYITGPDGASYVAVYTFQRQPDGSWKINGCTILKDESPSI
jgi:hypothetical protein